MTPGLSGKTKLAMVLMGYVPLLHGGGAVAPVALLPGWWRLTSLAWLLVLPAVVVRVSQAARPVPVESAVGGSGGGFLRWWWQAQWQVVFNRLPFIEEVVRLVPGLYVVWLRLWGSRVGRLVYWTPGLRVLDRQFLILGDGVTFGAGVSLNPHVIGPHPVTGEPTLLVAPVRVGDGASVGGQSTLLPGCHVGPGESSPPRIALRPFTSFINGRRVAPDAANAPAAAGNAREAA